MKLPALLLAACAFTFCADSLSAAAARQPNIIYIYADDIGYGDVSCYGAKAVSTPNVDRLARGGLRFTSGYATSGTCTPSRFSLLTGEYAFRQKGTGVLPGDAALIISPERATLPKVLRAGGYRTGVVGKWHLGLGANREKFDWNTDIKPGPLEIGFDYSFIMAATGDRVPCVYVENHKIVNADPKDPITVRYGQPFPGQPTGVTERDTLRMDWSHGHNNSIVNGVGRIGFMTGGKQALWVDEDMADVFLKHGLEFIRKEKDHPFFLYYATHDIHVPRLPHQRFVGKTTMGPRGDAIVEFDFQVGAILDELDRLGLTENTLVILSSDNGPVVDDGYKDRAVELLGDHKPAGPFRGGKYSRFEGGTRVPFIVRWPARVKPGVSDALVSQVDLMASFAALTGQTLAQADAPDSFNVLPALLGESRTGRDHIVEHATKLALRAGDWKYIEPAPGVALAVNTNTETANSLQPQLYNLALDPGEKRNLAAEQPQRVADLAARLTALQERGRSRP
ncbi:MAG: arylsulfatase [Opitutaceae bacterium]